MGLIGSIAGGALGAAGSIFGGISASKAMRRVKKNLQAQKEANQNWYDRRYNEDATQRADAQRILTQTEESTAAAKAANAQALADATSQIAVNAENRKDQIEQTYQQRDSQINEALNNLEINKAQAISQAVQGVAKAGAGIAGAF